MFQYEISVVGSDLEVLKVFIGLRFISGVLSHAKDSYI